MIQEPTSCVIVGRRRLLCRLLRYSTRLGGEGAERIARLNVGPVRDASQNEGEG